MSNKKIAPQLTINPSIIAQSRRWLTNMDESINPEDALFDELDESELAGQGIVALETWKAELARCAPDIIATDSSTLGEILEAIETTSKFAEKSSACNAPTEIFARKLTSISELSSVLAYIRPRVPLIEVLQRDSTVTTLAMYFYSQLSPLDADMAQKLLTYTEFSELLLKLAERAAVIGVIQAQKQCSFCGKNGHLEKECRKKKKREGKQEKVKQEPKKTSSQKVADIPYIGDIVIDSSAQVSTLPNKDQFSSYFPSISFTQGVRGVNVKCLGRGTFEFPDDQGVLVKIENVVHIPENKPIICHGQLAEIGYMWKRLPDGSVILDNDRGSTLSTQIGKKDMRTLAQHGLKTVIDGARCQSCIKAKIIRSPTPTTGLRRAERALEYLHLDLVGGQNSLPPATTSTDFPLASQFLLVVDEFSLYRWAFPVHSKKDVSTLIETLLEQLKNQRGRYPKTLHSDDASEFKSSQSLLLAERRGIIWSRSAGYAHEQNGIVERS
ncbi:hypothetical protein CFIMG_008218RA00001 [Ceratocystis fimbriata CBS 114723]|uniref:Retrovirus-related Pol polyprotein from transposon TNT 1-94 n=1 Tax=Ceratocystis fimbriata CBS 114723 TaxID=1035309 RepID=A0A2C5X4L6_9PEZI|nr:hypothetical protein CFIMG_008218RA00001 [Ceratocystis fimbriata CBS 114723]